MTTSRAEYLAKGVLGLESQPFSNIHSWRLCYDYFVQPDDAFDHDEGALRLGFFLTGNGGLSRFVGELRPCTRPLTMMCRATIAISA